MRMDRINLVCTLNGHTARVWCVAWHPKGRLLASCSEDKSIRLWVQEGSDRWVSAGVKNGAHSRTARHIVWSPCGQYLASAGFDGIACIWALRSVEGGGQELENLVSLEGHENEVKCVSWSPNGQYLATCGRDKSVWIWEVDEEFDCQCISVLQPHSQDVKFVRWHPSGTSLVSASYDNTVRVHREADDGDWETTATLAAHDATVWCLDFDTAGQRMVTCSADLSLRLWQRDSDSDRWQVAATSTGLHQEPIYHVAWCPASDLVASVGGDNRLQVVRASAPRPADARSGWALEERGWVEAHAMDVNGVAWSPAGDGVLATCSDDETVRVWRVEAEVD